MRRVPDADQRIVRLAALRTAWQVAVVATVVVVGMLLIAALFVVQAARPSWLLQRPGPGETKIYIESTQALAALALVGLGAVAVVGFASWGIARRAVTPLGSALRMQRSFVADASHELRTPLTVLDTRLQLLARKVASGQPFSGTLTEAQRDTRVMIDLVTDLLLVAEEPARRTGDPGGPRCGLRPVAEASVADLRLLAEERGVRIELLVAGDDVVAMSEVGLRRAMTVLIDNAVAHSADGGVVSVTAERDRQRVVVRVRDDGDGIVGIEPDRVFDRFAQGTASTRRRGFGLGLALVRDLVTRYGGWVAVESTGASGTVLRLELPVVR